MEKRESCGVFGITCNDFSYSVAGMIYNGLMALQHRGQLFTGISTYCNEKIFTYKNRGIVSKVLHPKKLKEFSGNIGIGHVNYGTRGITSLEDAQPFHFSSVENDFSIAINGTISNREAIIKKLRDMGKIITGNSDVELIATLIDTFYGFNEKKNMIDTFKIIFEVLEGAYSGVLLNNDGNIYCFRDPGGYKPLCHGILSLESKKFYIVASESCALDVLGASLIADVKPGEVIKINPVSGISSFQITKSKNTLPCLFEYIYFARPDSIMEGISIADVRYRLGKSLAKNDFFDLEDTIVVPVPDSGRSAAMGYAWEAQLPYQEGLIKNRYVWKLKIDDLREKLNVIKNVVRNKNVILIDDSILSGKTIKEIISMLKAAGVKSVHVRVSAPPIINNCEKNDSFSDRNLLIACRMREMNVKNYVEEIRKYIGADSLKFQTLQGLRQSLGVKKELTCKSCFSTEFQAKLEDGGKKLKLISLKS